MTSRKDLEGWRSLAASGGWIGTMMLEEAIDVYLEVPPPKGNPNELRAMSDTYKQLGTDADGAQVDTTNMAKSGLPDVWVGQAQEKASEVATAVAEELEHSVTVMNTASTELDRLAEGIKNAQDMHQDGQGVLRQAKNALDDQDRARTLALSGMDSVLKADDTARGCEETAAQQFTDLASQARASQLDSSHLDASDRLVLGQSAVPGGPHDVNIIMSENDAERAGKRLDQLSEADRKRFDALLDNAKSPQEKAYLMRALAAGHSVGDIEKFDGQIHGHGDDAEWLRNHLQPIYNTTDKATGQTIPVTYNGVPWEQTGNTCVAASTVTARAMVDPMYAFQLTTGGHPDDPNSTSADAFQKRYLEETERIYGRPANEGDGMTGDQSVAAADNEIGKATGQDYDYKDLNSTEDRAGIVDDVAKSVDQGKPVPVIVEGFDGGQRVGHQMMIIGHQGDMLQIYNPWGHTVWVSESDFVNGHMQGASDSRLPQVDAVDLPK